MERKRVGERQRKKEIIQCKTRRCSFSSSATCRSVSSFTAGEQPPFVSPPPLQWGGAFIVLPRGRRQEVSSNQPLMISLILWGCWRWCITDLRLALHSAQHSNHPEYSPWFLFLFLQINILQWMFQRERPVDKRRIKMDLLTDVLEFPAAHWRWTNFDTSTGHIFLHHTHHSNRKAAFVTACHAIFYSESMAGWETS